jgi:rhomboid protease GluP
LNGVETERPYHQYTVVRENWLTRRLDPSAFTLSALITLSLIFVSLLNWRDVAGFAASMPANSERVFTAHEWWRAWTTLFVHADLRHLLSNALLFSIMGVFLIGYFGVWVFPTAALFAGGLVNLIVLRGMPQEVELIGASGVVFWMGGFWLTLYFCLESRRSLSQRTLRAIGVALALFMPTETFDPSVSYASHLWGFVFGVAMGLIYYLMRRRDFLAAEVRELIVEEA